MRLPQEIVADSLLREWPMTELRACSGESVKPFWALARPLYTLGGLRHRLKLAWLVFAGKRDALKWVQQ